MFFACMRKHRCIRISQANSLGHRLAEQVIFPVNSPHLSRVFHCFCVRDRTHYEARHSGSTFLQILCGARALSLECSEERKLGCWDCPGTVCGTQASPISSSCMTAGVPFSFGFVCLRGALQSCWSWLDRRGQALSCVLLCSPLGRLTTAECG